MKRPEFNIRLEEQRDRRMLRFFPLLSFLFFMVFALPQMAKAQNFNPLISFSVESCTLDEALEKLFSEYELNVAFSKAELSKIRIESYSCSYKSVDEVLSDLLKGTDYGFKRIGKQYVIRKNQQLVGEPDATVTKPAEPNVEVVKPKTETVTNQAGDTIYETSYAPNRLTYRAHSANGGVAVFSEIFFPWGWNVTIDGKPAQLGRVNYVLRALRVPAGDHTIAMDFHPTEIERNDNLAKCAIAAIFALMLAAGAVYALRRRKPAPSTDANN